MADDRRRPVDHADYQRFVAFTFAASDLVVEVGSDRRLSYAAGTFPADFGTEADRFVGQPVGALIAVADHDLLDLSLTALSVSGRLEPCVVRLASKTRKKVSMTGLSLPSPDGSTRFCLCFSRLPEPREQATTSPDGLIRRATAALRDGSGQVDLLEIVVEGAAAVDPALVERALQTVAPHATTSVLANGRYGLLGARADKNGGDLGAEMRDQLRAGGVTAAITAHQLPLDGGALTPVQAARALRHALSAFTRDGVTGLRASGCADGLGGYLRQTGALAGHLRRMIREESFKLVFQPIVSLAGREVRRYEALIRPDRTTPAIKTPQEFVLMVEAIGLAEELDAAVVRHVCEAACTSGQAVAVNLSSQSVQSGRFRDEVVDTLGRSRAGERKISVELTETAEIEDLRAVAETAARLRTIGVSLAVDDFGTGSASVEVLRAVEPDVVKIDGSFTSGIATSKRARALLQGMVGMARSASDRVVAERIETEEEARILLSMAVDEGQGWLFGRPKALPLRARASSVGARVKETREVWGR